MNWFKQMASAIGKSSLHQNVVNPLLKGGAKDMLKASTQLKLQGVAIGLTLLGKGSPEEKIHSVAQGVGMFMLTAGMRNPWRQGLWQLGLTMAPHFPDMARGTVQGYRGVLESRTMASIPFSYSTLPGDQAFAAMQYGQSRMNDAYSTIGSEATFMHARYLSR